MNLIEFKNVFYNYEENQSVLNDITFSISQGESLGLIGRNGSGKSTILKNLIGILFPTSGEIIIDNIPLTKKTLDSIRKKIGVVFQNPEHQLFTSSVFEDLAFAPLNYGIPKDTVESSVNKMLKLLSIEDLKDKAPYKLSIGQKHMVAIGTALITDPNILILDEPTAALDPKSRREIINFLNSNKKTKIIASHDLDMILECCERVLIIDKGFIVYDGKTIDILTNEDFLKNHNLELPLSLQKVIAKIK